MDVCGVEHDPEPERRVVPPASDCGGVAAALSRR